MSYRWLVLPIVLFSAGPTLVSVGVAAEASVLSKGVPSLETQAGTERARIAARLVGNGFVLNGNFRRKGQFIVLNANKDGAEWRLVLDVISGDIIGKRPISPILTVSQ